MPGCPFTGMRKSERISVEGRAGTLVRCDHSEIGMAHQSYDAS
jgi:hypothetical protein